VLGNPERDNHDGGAASLRGHKACHPAGGLGQRYSEITVCLDQNCGADDIGLTKHIGNLTINCAAYSI